VLQEIVERACDVIVGNFAVNGGNCAVIYPYDALREEFYDVDSAAHHGLRHALDPKDRPGQDGLGEYLDRRGELLRSDIEQQEPNLLDIPLVAREELRAFMGIALKLADRLVGLLYIGFRTPHQFSDEERHTFQLFAQQAALEIDYSRLYRRATARDEALKKLHDVASTRALMSFVPESLDATLTEIAQCALSALGADLIDLYQCVASRDEYVLPPIQVGERYGPQVRKDRVYEDDVLRDLVRKRRAQYSPDAQQEPILTQPYTVRRADVPSARFVIREDVKSVAVIPLVSGTRPVGVLFVNYRTPQVFPRQQRELIELFASQAAMAIGNVRQFGRLGSLREISRDITRIDEKDQLLQSILERSLELLEANAGGILLLDRGTNQMKYHCVVQKDREQTIDLGKSLIGAAARTTKPVRVGDVTKFSRFVDHVDTTRSELDVPILVGDELLGVLNLESERLDAFGEDDEELGIVLANLAAVALQGAAPFAGIQERLEQRLDDISVLQHVYESITRTDLQDIMRLIAEKALELTGAKYAGLWLLDSTESYLEIGAAAGDERPTHEWPTIPMDMHSIDGRVALTRLTYVGADTTQDEHYSDRHDDTRSQLTVPLLSQGRTLGTLSVEGTTAHGFSEDHRLLLEAMAGQAATAIEHARLVKKLEILADVGRWWAQRGSPAIPSWLTELVELRAASSRTGQAPHVELFLSDGRQLEGEWENLSLVSGKDSLFEIAIRQTEQNQVIWVAADNISEMNATAAGRSVKLILGELAIDKSDGRESRVTALPKARAEDP